MALVGYHRHERHACFSVNLCHITYKKKICRCITVPISFDVKSTGNQFFFLLVVV